MLEYDWKKETVPQKLRWLQKRNPKQVENITVNESEELVTRDMNSARKTSVSGLWWLTI